MGLVDWGEFREGITETRRYLLSHHRPEDWDRCYALTVHGTQYHLCARCSGVYPGIVLGLVAYLGGVLPSWHWVVILMFPIPALVDWWLSSTGIVTSWNPLRTVTGGLLGGAFGLGLGLFFGSGSLWVVGVGGLYGATALVLLYRYREPYVGR